MKGDICLRILFKMFAGIFHLLVVAAYHHKKRAAVDHALVTMQSGFLNTQLKQIIIQ